MKKVKPDRVDIAISEGAAVLKALRVIDTAEKRLESFAKARRLDINVSMYLDEGGVHVTLRARHMPGVGDRVFLGSHGRRDVSYVGTSLMYAELTIQEAAFAAEIKRSATARHAQKLEAKVAP